MGGVTKKSMDVEAAPNGLHSGECVIKMACSIKLLDAAGYLGLIVLVFFLARLSPELNWHAPCHERNFKRTRALQCTQVSPFQGTHMHATHRI